MKRDVTYHKAYIAMTSGTEEVYQAALMAAHKALSSEEEGKETSTLFVVPDELPLEGSTCYIAPRKGETTPYLSVNESKTPHMEVYMPEPTVKRPPGLASLGIDAFKLECHINDVNGSMIEVVADSGAAATLVSVQCLNSLGDHSPTIKQGLKLKLLHLTGEAWCLGYVTLTIYFCSQLGPMLLQGVKAYVVEGMNANLLIGEDTHCAWQLHTMRPEHNAYWQVGNSKHCIPANCTSRDEEAFTASWLIEDGVPNDPHLAMESEKVKSLDPLVKPHPGKGKIFAQEDICIPTGHVAWVQVKGDFDHRNGLELIEKCILWRSSHSFLTMVDCLVDTSEEVTLLVVNPSSMPKMLHWGEVLGFMIDPSECLKKRLEVNPEVQTQFEWKASFICTLVEGSLGKQDLNHTSTGDLPRSNGEVHEEAMETVGSGLKIAKPSYANNLRSQDLEKLIDMDPSLAVEQRAQVYKVLKEHKMAFRFDSHLDKHPMKVHIELIPRTKPISLVPYIASPAKRELIDKQLDLWLQWGVIEPSKSPWGAPVLIMHQHSKDHLCVDWRKLNAVTISDQFPIGKVTFPRLSLELSTCPLLTH
jgi:hypothetical protein